MAPSNSQTPSRKASANLGNKRALPKAPSGIEGLDEIAGGGLPRGRPTLACGGAGCGKTMFAVEFLVRQASQYGEPDVFMAFEDPSGIHARSRRMGSQ